MQKSSLPYSTTIYSVQLQLYIQNLLNFDSVACLPVLSFSGRWKGGKERKGFSVVSSRVNVLRGNEKRGIKGGGREKGREQSAFESGGGRKKEEDETRFDRRVTGDFALRGWASTVGRVDFFFFFFHRVVRPVVSRGGQQVRSSSPETR